MVYKGKPVQEERDEEEDEDVVYERMILLELKRERKKDDFKCIRS